MQDDCQGQCSGLVNGVLTCHACGSNDTPKPSRSNRTSNTTSTNTATNTTTNVTTNTTTTTNNNTVNQTTTTTTTTTNSDGTSSTSVETTSSESDRSAFCEANPTHELCIDSDECEENPDRIGCMKAGTPGEETIVTQEKVIPEQITVEDFGPHTGTCPSPVQLSHGVTLSYDLLCDGLDMIRPLFLAIAWIIAGTIVIGGFRNQ